MGYGEKRVQSERFSRRTALKWSGTTAVGILGTSLVGCGDDDDGETPTASVPGTAATTAGGTPLPKQQGTIKTGEPQPLDQFDVQASLVNNALYMVRSQYSNLVKYQGTDLNVIKGDLAKSHEFADDLTFVVHLNSARFHDGSPVTSEDVKFSINRLLEPPKGFFSESGDSFRSTIDSVETPEPNTVRFKLKRPAASLLRLLAPGGQSGWIFPKAAVDRDGDEVFKTKVNGSGPFKFKRHEPGVLYEVERNKDYFKPGLPYADGIQYAVVEDPVARREALRSGQINLIPVRPGISVDDMKQFQGNDKLTVTTAPAWAPCQLVFNTRRAPWSDQRVRRAVALLLDAEAALATVDSGHGFPAGLVPAQSKWGIDSGSVKKAAGFRKPDDEARRESAALLEQAGVKLADIQVNMIYKKAGLFEPTAVFAQDQFRKLGMKAEIELLEVPKHTARLQAFDYDVLPMHWVVRSDDPDDSLNDNFQSKSPRNLSGVNDPALDALLEKQSRTLVEADRKKLANEAEASLLDKSVTLVFFWIERRVATRSEVHDYVAVSGGAHNIDYEEVWLS